MNILKTEPQAVRAWHEREQIHVELSDGRQLAFPVAANQRLRKATPQQRDRIDLSPFGLHWPDIDEDLSLAGLLAGRFGLKQGGRRNGAGRKSSGHVRMQICVSPVIRNHIRKLARAQKTTLSAVVEQRFRDLAKA